MNAIIALTVAGVASLLLFDVGCYLWLRHNAASAAVARKRLRPRN